MSNEELAALALGEVRDACPKRGPPGEQEPGGARKALDFRSLRTRRRGRKPGRGSRVLLAGDWIDTDCRRRLSRR